MKTQRRRMAAAALIMLAIAIYTGQSMGAQNADAQSAKVQSMGAQSAEAQSAKAQGMDAQSADVQDANIQGAEAQGAEAQKLSNEDFIRFHVVANSDTPEDQELKLRVRDGVLQKINEGLTEYAVSRKTPLEGRIELTMEESRQYIKGHLEEISQVAQQIIRTNGYRYSVAASLGPRRIPEKTYGSLTFPAGEYEALNLVIGEGGGENWWCVLFPPLCTVGARPADEKYDVLWEAMESEEPVRLHLKFKTLEYLEQIGR